MQAIDHGSGGSPDCLRLVDLPRPALRTGEVLIRVLAAGVNRPDVLQRQGRYPPPADASPLLGLEVAGVVAEVGEGVEGISLDDEVCALVPGGGYAEYCRVPAGCVLPKPASLDFVHAAAMPETWFTVWANLVDMATLRAGERLLVHGGASGIGLCAIQLARLIGAECYVTVGSEAKQVFCESFGAARAINYRQQDFADIVKSDGGVDVILDMVGAPYWQRNLSVLRKDGRLAYIAFLEGSSGEIDLLPLMLKRLRIMGSTLRPRSLAEKAALRDTLLREVWPRIDETGLTPHVCAQFPLADAAQAHALMESNGHIGKIVLTLT
jgi:putative PIG3 family NAD(P)H quinone oxidoreductase